MTDAQKKVMLPIMMGVLLILSLGAMTLYYFAARSAMFMSTPEGVAQTDRMLAYSSEMDARRHAEEMKALENQGKRIDERRGLRSEKTASRDSVATSNTGKASPEAKCTVLEGAGNSRRQPAKLGTRICFSRESTETGHWLFLEAPVTKIQGVIRFSEMNMVADENGKMQILGEKDSCATNQSTDNCLTWLKGYVGTTTLWFTNRGPVEISAK